MSTFEIEEIILALILIAPFVLIGAGAAYLLLAGDPCGEVEQ